MTNKEAQFATLAVALEHNRIMHILNNRENLVRSSAASELYKGQDLKLKLKNDKDWKI